MNAYDMAIDELTDAVVWKRPAVLAPSQAEQILKELRRGDADHRRYSPDPVLPARREEP